MASHRRARRRVRRQRASDVRGRVRIRRARSRHEMKLRGRFTLTLALAALVPISVAAIAATRVIATTYREDYEQRRAATEKVLHDEITRLQIQVRNVAVSLAGNDNPFVENLLPDLRNGQGTLDASA